MSNRARTILKVTVAIVILYVASVYVRGHFVESGAENYLSNALVDFSKPWNVERLELYASEEMKNNPALPPDKLVAAVESELGSMVEIVVPPSCELNSGTHSGSSVEHIYALCDLNVAFENKTVHMTIRLIEEGPNRNWKFFNFIEINALNNISGG